MSKDFIQMAKDAKSACYEMGRASNSQKTLALQAIIEGLKRCRIEILQANEQDVLLARARGLSDALLERLSLTNRLEGIIHDMEQVILLPDPLEEKGLPQTL